MIQASAFRRKADHRFLVGTKFFSESICLENKRNLPKFIEQEFAIYSAQKNLCCNKKRRNGFTGSTFHQSWAKIPVLTSAPGSERSQGKALTSALQGWRPQCLCTLHNGFCQKDKREGVCVGGIQLVHCSSWHPKKACACLPSCGIPATPQSWCVPRWRKP